MKIRLATEKDVQELAKVHVDSWRSTYEGIVDPAFLERLSYEDREQRWTQIIAENPPFVAVHEEGKIVGFAGGGKERFGNLPPYDGEVYAIYILEAYQRQGIGRKLIRAVVEQLMDEGYTSMAIRVLSENDACLFYEAIGGKIIDEEELTIGNKIHKGIVYGWDSLKSVINNLT